MRTKVILKKILRYSKILRYRDIDQALYDVYKFGRNFVIIDLSGAESLEEILTVYDYITVGIIKSKKNIEGVKCNSIIFKKGKNYVPKLSRMENGLLVFQHKRLDPRLLKVKNGKIVKNYIFATSDLEVFYRGEKLEIPKLRDTTSAIHAYSGILFNEEGEIVKSTKNHEKIIDLVPTTKNVILKSDEDFKLFDEYRDKLENLVINSEKECKVNVYMTYQTFLKVGDITKISIFHSQVLEQVRYLQNYTCLNELLNKKEYFFETVKEKAIYVIDAKKQYRGVTHLPSKVNQNINDSILIFESVKQAKNYLSYFENNDIIIHNNRNYRTSLSVIKYAKKLYVTKSEARFINDSPSKITYRCNSLNFEGKQYYQIVGQYLNNIDRSNIVYYPGDIEGGYLFNELPKVNATNQKIELNSITKTAIRIDKAQDKDKYSENVDYAICNNEVYASVKLNVVNIFDMRIDGTDIIIEVFHHGYRKKKDLNELIYAGEYKIEQSNKYKFYSKNSFEYKENFITYRLKNVSQVKLTFEYEGKECLVKTAKHLRNRIIRNGLYISIKNKVACIKPMSKVKRTRYELEIEKKCTESYLFMDRGTSAGDNAEHMYRHYLKHDKKRIHYYILSKSSNDWTRLESEGFNLIEYQSDDHKDLFLTADKIVTSHLAPRIFNPFFPARNYEYLVKSKIVFLQHGIIISNHRSFLDRYSRPLDLFICGASEEKEQVLSFSEYSNVQSTGLARFDFLKNQRKGYILYAPSWNTIYRDNFVTSKYHKEVQKVLEDKIINRILESNNLRLKLLLHPEFIKFSEHFTPTRNVDIINSEEVNYNKFISEADMLITDYSSLYFDFLYQEKHVIWHQPYELHNKTSILKKNERCVRRSYCIEELASCLLEIERLNFESDRKSEILDFFGRQIDKNNCERIRIEIEKL